MSLLGAWAPGLFRDYADRSWPEGHRRHVRDAADFGGFLATRQRPLCRSEWNRARFSAGTSALWVGYARDVWIGGRARGALELFLRWRGSVRSVAIYLGL